MLPDTVQTEGVVEANVTCKPELAVATIVKRADAKRKGDGLRAKRDRLHR